MGLAIKPSLTLPRGTPRSATGADASCIAVSTERSCPCVMASSMPLEGGRGQGDDEIDAPIAARLRSRRRLNQSPLFHPGAKGVPVRLLRKNIAKRWPRVRIVDDSA
jgi:hypothetical protein